MSVALRNRVPVVRGLSSCIGVHRRRNAAESTRPILGGEAPAFVRAQTQLAAGQEPSAIEHSGPEWKAR